MKKIIVLLSLHLVYANTFSQNIIFQDNFEKGKLNAAWKIPASQCSVINLENKGIKPSTGGNNFALASMGNADILVDIPVENNSLSVTTQFTFNYWITHKNAKATVNILFLKENGDLISSLNFADLSEKAGWDLFNQSFKIPGGSSVMRLKLVARAPSVGGNSVYFQNICFGCSRSR